VKIAPIGSGKSGLVCGVNGGHDGDQMIVFVDDPGLVAVGWRDKGLSLAGITEVVPFAKFRDTHQTTVFDVAVCGVIGLARSDSNKSDGDDK